MEFWLRPHYQSPITRLTQPMAHMTTGPKSIPTAPGAPGWILSQGLVDGTGKAPSAAPQNQIYDKLGGRPNAEAATAYLRGLGLQRKVVYQPADRFWTFQIIEASLFVGLATALLGLAIWHLHHRST